MKCQIWYFLKADSGFWMSQNQILTHKTLIINNYYIVLLQIKKDTFQNCPYILSLKLKL